MGGRAARRGVGVGNVPARAGIVHLKLLIPQGGGFCQYESFQLGPFSL